MKKLLLPVLFSLIISLPAAALTRTSVVNGAWNNPATWNPAGVPLPSDDTIIINTTVSFTQNIIFGMDLFHITPQGTLVDQGNDTCTFGGNKLLIEGYFETTVLVIGCTDSAINRFHVLVTSDFAQSGLLYNSSSGEICVQMMFSSSDDIVNEGSISADNWVNGATVTGVNGQFCVYNIFINTDNIGGTVDVCDATPGGMGDVNAGVIASTVTNCADGPCGGCLQPGYAEYYNMLSVEIVPHPVTGVSQMIFSAIPQSGSNTIVVMDVSGRIVRTCVFSGSTWTFDRSGLDQGIYLYTLSNNGTVLHSGKITVQ